MYYFRKIRQITYNDNLLKIGPYKNIKPSWDLERKEVKLYSKLNAVINKLIYIAITQKYIDNKDKLRTEGECNQLFNRCYRFFYLNQDPKSLTGNVALCEHYHLEKGLMYFMFQQ